MEPTTTEVTNTYLREHPDIKLCLKKGIINYSSLARLIAQELKIEKKTSKEAILIAARRFRETLRKENDTEQKIQELLARSEIAIKNKIVVFVLEKRFPLERLDDAFKEIRKQHGIAYLLEGSDNYTIIAQERHAQLIRRLAPHSLIKEHRDHVLINIQSPKEIEHIRGVLTYLTGLFSENGVNITEFLSCWTDTLFVIKAEDLPKAIGFLNCAGS